MTATNKNIPVSPESSIDRFALSCRLGGAGSLKYLKKIKRCKTCLQEWPIWFFRKNKYKLWQT